MRHLPNLRIERYRQTHPILGNSMYGANWGFFIIPCRGGLLRVIASDGCSAEERGWEHVSVSLNNRTPTWDEMRLVKELFWHDEETVFQFHPAKSQYRNCHPYVLHLWRQSGREIELPPGDLIAPQTSPPDSTETTR